MWRGSLVTVKYQFCGNSKKDELKIFKDLVLGWRNCRKCGDLALSRSRVVFGSGNPDAKLMFISEAPGENEDDVGIPFVGVSGDLVNVCINQLGLTRSDVYVTNTVMCRPTDAKGGNRAPTIREARHCFPRLEQEIFAVDPWLIVVLGGVALKGLFNDNTLLVTKMRGEVLTLKLPGFYTSASYPVIVMQHPSYVLRDPSRGQNSRLWYFIEDCKLLYKIYSCAEQLYTRRKEERNGKDSKITSCTEKSRKTL